MPVRSNLKVKVAAIGFAPILFWMLATGVEIVRRDPEAFDTPFVYLAATWVLYLPVFGVAGALVIVFAHSFRLGPTVSIPLGALGGAVVANLCLRVACYVYRLPMQAWPMCFAVGAVMGAVLARLDSSATSEQFRAAQRPRA